VGSGSVLTGLIRRIAPSTTDEPDPITYSFGNPQDVEAIGL
jgi:hypothetical protein